MSKRSPLCRFGRTIDHHGRIRPCRRKVTGHAPRPEPFHPGFADNWDKDASDMWPACTRHSRERALAILGKDTVWAIARLWSGSQRR